MAKKKKTTLEKVTGAIQDAATTVAKAAEAHVVKPVGKALGLTDAAKAGGKPAAGKADPKLAAKPGQKAAPAKEAAQAPPAPPPPPEPKPEPVKKVRVRHVPKKAAPKGPPPVNALTGGGAGAGKKTLVSKVLTKSVVTKAKPPAGPAATGGAKAPGKGR